MSNTYTMLYDAEKTIRKMKGNSETKRMLRDIEVMKRISPEMIIKPLEQLFYKIRKLNR